MRQRQTNPIEPHELRLIILYRGLRSGFYDPNELRSTIRFLHSRFVAHPWKRTETMEDEIATAAQWWKFEVSEVWQQEYKRCYQDVVGETV